MREPTAIALGYAGVAAMCALIGARDIALGFCGCAAMVLVMGYFARNEAPRRRAKSLPKKRRERTPGWRRNR